MNGVSCKLFEISSISFSFFCTQAVFVLETDERADVRQKLFHICFMYIAQPVMTDLPFTLQFFQRLKQLRILA